ncbi:MAG TPA: LETM1-related biofilm-associated protein [Flavobacteriaceae bacterium]|nr:LETM1-related biofilm-associated protein [Flavobacteriaceae bacterium]
MNPSAQGWLKKLLQELNTHHEFLTHDAALFYQNLRSSGFIYGTNVNGLVPKYRNADLTEEEFTKLNLVSSLFYIFSRTDTDKENFAETAISFYQSISEFKPSFLDEILGEKKGLELLEKIIHKRIHIDDNIITKNFNYFITNAVLFSDVLAFKVYLENPKKVENYLKKLETAIEVSVYKAFNTKETKSEYDKSLMKLFEVSLRYKSETVQPLHLLLPEFKQELEKYYLLDLTTMAIWSDKVIDKQERAFLSTIAGYFELNTSIVNDSINQLDTFYVSYKDKIPLLNSKNPVQSFYDNSGRMVNKLIKRNKKRLLRELKESKELMYLIKKSTTNSLSEEEQKKMQNQLLDIFKSIPSLAIFMLPGGMLLLPIVIKFIPKLLPSAFDDNRIENE